MEEGDLDMMLLAAVAGPSDGNKGSSPGGNVDSGDDFDDDGSGDDFDEDSDSESPSEDEADDDDDNEESLHPDDPDYDGGAGSKRKHAKTKGSRANAKKALPQKPKKKKIGKGKPPSKKARSSAAIKDQEPVDVGEDEDAGEETFVYEYDADGYGDAADRARMNAMNMMERETILTERVDQRNEKHKLWLMTRKMKNDAAKKTSARSSGRAKPTKAGTDAALEGLRSDKLAKKESATRRANLDEFDEESEDGQTKGRQKADVNEEDADSADGVDGDLYSKRASKEEIPMQYEDLVVQGQGYGGDRRGEPTHLFLPRDKIHELVQEPYFDRAVTGLFCRLPYVHRDQTEPVYYLCTIDSVRTLKKVYTVDTAAGSRIKTNKYLTVRIGKKMETKMPVTVFSNSVPTKKEFLDYAERLEQEGMRVPVRTDVADLLSHARKMTSSKNKPQVLPEEEKAFIANQEILYPEKVNWTERKGTTSIEVDHVRTELENARRRGDTAKTAELEANLAEVEGKLRHIEAQLDTNLGGTSRSQQLFTSMARKNEALNSENERLAASKRAMDSTVGGIDPFARFDTTGMSYFSIKGQKDVKVEDGNDSRTKPPRKPSSSRHSQKITGDWKLALSTWRPSSHAKSTSESSTPLISAYGNVYADLIDFSGDCPQVAPQVAFSTSAPPVVDALYLHQVQVLDDSGKLVNGKALTLQEYNHLRTE